MFGKTYLLHCGFVPLFRVYSLNEYFCTLFVEPIQSRCCVLRYTRLTDSEVLDRLLTVCEKENVVYDDTGLEAIIFTAEGDMRQVCSSVKPFRVLLHPDPVSEIVE